MCMSQRWLAIKQRDQDVDEKRILIFQNQERIPLNFGKFGVSPADTPGDPGGITVYALTAMSITILCPFLGHPVGSQRVGYN
jgi:hypothetical protein